MKRISTFTDMSSGRVLFLFATAFALATFVAPSATFAQIRAFPGAEGFGAYATGGRSGDVYHVITLADSGPGSFRDAVSVGKRIVVFDVGGYITLSSEVSVQDDITIAGQTAPGGGIGIKGREVSFGTSTNIIYRPRENEAVHSNGRLTRTGARWEIPKGTIN
jgi:hypothetical protein